MSTNTLDSPSARDVIRPSPRAPTNNLGAMKPVIEGSQRARAATNPPRAPNLPSKPGASRSSNIDRVSTCGQPLGQTWPMAALADAGFMDRNQAADTPPATATACAAIRPRCR